MMQLSFHDQPLPSPRESGQDRVESHNREFVAQMRIIAKQICKERGTVSTDDLRRYADAHGIVPPHFKAYSVIFRGKDWAFVAWKPSEIPSNNGRRIAIYTFSSNSVKGETNS